MTTAFIESSSKCFLLIQFGDALEYPASFYKVKWSPAFNLGSSLSWAPNASLVLLVAGLHNDSHFFLCNSKSQQHFRGTVVQ